MDVSSGQQACHSRPGSSFYGTPPNTSLFSQAVLSQRIVNVEYYMSDPAKDLDNLYSEFRNNPVKKVPVIRIFGSTHAGQKLCTNIHGVYPYISVLDDETVEGFEHKIATALDNAINDSVNTGKFRKGGPSHKSAATQHVFSVIRVIGKTFYGYRPRNEVFIRIFFYNPLMLRKGIDLLQSGNILGRRFQPYEAHIPYTLQFMIDYCLYGMNFIHYTAVKFRRNSNATKSENVYSLSQGSNSPISGYIDPDCIEESLLGPIHLKKGTSCELEIDVKACDIILETKISEKTVSLNPGIDSIWKDEMERRRIHGIENSSQITIPESQDRPPTAAVIHSAEEKHLQLLYTKLESFFENEEEIFTEQNGSLSFNNITVTDDTDVIPSSQIHDHLSCNDPPKDISASNNHLSQEQDDFLKLLEKMAKEPYTQPDHNGIEEDPFSSPMYIDDEFDSLPDSDGNGGNSVWDDSFLSSSILEKISDTEKTYYEESDLCTDSVPGSSKTVFQCDGQADDSDSSNSDNKKSLPTSSKRLKEVITTRLSKRMSEARAKNSVSTVGDAQSHSTASRKAGRSSRNLSSPANSNRLSLTLRRKSRSQDVIKLKEQETSTSIVSTSDTPNRKSLPRRSSRSMSVDHERRLSTKGSSALDVKDKPLNDDTRTRVSRPVTRKSISSSTKNGKEKSLPSKANTLTDSTSIVSRKKGSGVQITEKESIKILKKVPYVCLTKIDIDPGLSMAANITPKRLRRKPRRFVEEDNGDSTTVQCKNSIDLKDREENSKPSTPEETEPEENSKPSTLEETKPEENNQIAGETSGKYKKSKTKRQLKNSAKGTENINSKVESKDAISMKRIKKRGQVSQDVESSHGISIELDEMVNKVMENGTDDDRTMIKREQSNAADTILKERGVKKSQKTDLKTADSIPPSNVCNDADGSKNIRKIITRAENIQAEEECITEKRQLKTNGKSSERKCESTHMQKQTSEVSVTVVSTQAESNEKSINESHTSTKNQALSKKRKRLGMGMPKLVKKEEANIADAPSVIISDTPKNDHNEEVDDKPQPLKKFVEFGITCKPDNTSAMSQTITTSVFRKNASSLVKPTVEDSGSQVGNPMSNNGTQTNEKIMVSIETQTDLIAPLCLCQCACVIKEKSEASNDTQDDLKPVMENKRIQVDNVDMITRARSARFTTPQGNKTKRATPKSPEKRKPFPESPSRGQLISGTVTPSHSRYLSALILKTPTSHHKYKGLIRSNPSTPTNDSHSSQDMFNITPPSRESREGYLINSIRAASHSPRKRLGSIRPRNLGSETGRSAFAIQAEKEIANKYATARGSDKNEEAVPASIEDEMRVAMENENSCENDLSVNSIYEYEDSTPGVHVPTVSSEDGEDSPSISLTSFQRKRILSKHRTKNRLEKRRAANLDANRCIPDVFKIEYEPLKQPASYKSTMKWLEAEKNRTNSRKESRAESNQISSVNGSSSDEECLPPPVKLFGGGNMSDDDEDSDAEQCSSGISTNGNVNCVKPFTPPTVNLSQASLNDSPNNSECGNDVTPRSILRQSGVSRRQLGRVLKRKIRWEDESTCKKLKTEGNNITVKRETDDDSQSLLLSGDSFNKTVNSSELDGPTFKNALGLENSMSNFQDAKALHQCQFLTTMCIEVHCTSRNGLLPDPTMDSIVAIFVLISNDYPDNFNKHKQYLRLLLLDENAETLTTNNGELSQSTKAYSSEENLLNAFVELVRLSDPDILVGYEIEKSSLGYLIQRGAHFGKNVPQELSRVYPVIRKPGDKNLPFREHEEWNGTIGGRIVLNLWRLLRHEIAVQSYTFENAAYHILLRRVCKFSQKALSSFWSHKMHRYKVIQYYTIRVKGAMQIMEKLDLINRTSELARLFGIQFYEVLSRGSQFRVESMMLRATKSLDLIAPSPTVLQRAKMRAPEYLPLIMEPRSNYYTDPVAVLDFQSLYPSMMIAYNYDYASLLGRVENLGQMESFPMGCMDHTLSPADLSRLKDHIHVSPAGVAFLNKSFVKGVLPEMLEQILDTRQMVKRSMKKWKNEGASLQKVLDSRQLGLKLIANVTYGYTSANFSGRMPCVEIADSIVSKGRETLQRAINYVKEHSARWGAEVIYGDTDSMFILFRGKTRAEAFKSAYQIADEITQTNPKPVKLKFEKIYQPCILQSKKRYVGYSYETPEQKKPTYDAKGIETVRRDGCPAVKKILEKTLHVLFTSNKPEKVEQYVKSQFEKLFKGRVSMQDYIFAREYRGRAGYKPAACVPSLEISKRLVGTDPRAEPLVSERVPYVVIYGNPTLPLIKLVRTPQEYLENSALRLNAHYYIEKVIIPALNRCLLHAGLNASKWYLQMPRKYLRNILEQKSKGQGTLDDYILHQNCLRCDGRAESGLCSKCLSEETSSVIYLQEVLRDAKSKLNACVEICTNCAGEVDRCVSIDCPILHKLTRYQRDQAYMKNIERELVKLDW